MQQHFDTEIMIMLVWPCALCKYDTQMTQTLSAMNLKGKQESSLPPTSIPITTLNMQTSPAAVICAHKPSVYPMCTHSLAILLDIPLQSEIAKNPTFAKLIMFAFC